MMKLQATYKPWSGGGLEEATAEFTPLGATVSSRIGWASRKASYLLEHRATDVRLLAEVDGMKLELRRDALGAWSEDGEPRADLEGCSEVDLVESPMTNALAIRHLALEPGASATLRVAHVELAMMSVVASEQIYTRLDERTYRFATAGFERDLALDADGLVREYPGLFRRTA